MLQAAWSTSIGHLGALPLFDPPLGLCTLILNAAARTALPALALEVISYIQAAELPVYEHHYAALLEAHARAGDHLSTFAVLSTMRAARVSPTPNTAHAAVMTLAASRSATDTAASLLAASSTPVDIAAVELIMQAYTLHHDLDAAFATYSLIPDVCPREQRASLRTFNILLAGCMRTRNWEFAQYVRAEMRELGVELDAGTYSMLVRVLVAVEEGGEGGPGEALFEAFVHLEEMKSKALRMAKIAYEELACACARRGEEERTKAVVREMEDVGWGAEGVWETLEREGLWWGPVDSTVESGCE